MHPENMNRKLFLKLTLTGVATSVIAACGGDEENSTDPIMDGNTGTTSTTGTVTNTNTASTSGVTNAVTTGTSTTGATGSTGTTMGTTGSTGGTQTTTGATGSTTGTTSSTTGATGTTTGSTTGTGTSTATSGGGSTGTSTETASSGGGMGGTGNTAMCTTAMLTHTANVTHTHLPLTAEEEMEFVMLFNGGAAGSVEWNGGSPHAHTITLTADEVMMIVNGGMVMNKATDPDDTMHSHTYTISCA